MFRPKNPEEAKVTKKNQPLLTCTLKSLPKPKRIPAARQAIAVNPLNAPAGVHPPERLALLTTKYWGSAGVRLTVSFLEDQSDEFKARILSHMNAWSDYCNAEFSLVATGGQVRISTNPGGYYSYLGTDILSIPSDEPTMNLEGFDMDTVESEYHRVVRHETGHTLGFPHEHARAEIIALLDPAKVIASFEASQGWSEQEIRDQILTPLDPASIIATPTADETSIMTYQFDGSVTLSGQPIPGGTDIDVSDQGFAAKVYPLDVTNPPPPPPPPPPVTPPVTTGTGCFDHFLLDLAHGVPLVEAVDELMSCVSGQGQLKHEELKALKAKMPAAPEKGTAATCLLPFILAVVSGTPVPTAMATFIACLASGAVVPPITTATRPEEVPTAVARPTGRSKP